ncbi:uncharacterized protein LOC110859495 isoform X1 [Folsomia candida]|uniref:Uncharacterized protein n=1 Tax=Folsomia candida TaxID=158441 RepID=A0A226D9I9_FOLCA|nr:uncharacterized protein LOC110859495 isoform X1 [Folsomia candida]OXA42212.1 hypothetical protein Fcan01_22940 [Folsomia candida]
MEELLQRVTVLEEIVSEIAKWIHFIPHKRSKYCEETSKTDDETTPQPFNISQSNVQDQVDIEEGIKIEPDGGHLVDLFPSDNEQSSIEEGSQCNKNLHDPLDLSGLDDEDSMLELSAPLDESLEPNHGLTISQNTKNKGKSRNPLQCHDNYDHDTDGRAELPTTDLETPNRPKRYNKLTKQSDEINENGARNYERNHVLDHGLSTGELSDDSSDIQRVKLDSSSPTESLLREFRRFRGQSLKNQDMLLEKMTYLEKLVKQSTTIPSSFSTRKINWPAKTLEELEHIETLLEDQSYYTQEVANLSRKGGSSLSKDVYDMLHSMITNDLRSKIRYTGKSDKIPFANRLTANLLRDSVRATNPDPSMKDSQINHHIGCWFRMKVASN